MKIWHPKTWKRNRNAVYCKIRSKKAYPCSYVKILDDIS